MQGRSFELQSSPPSLFSFSKLDASNYSSWRSNMKALLQVQDCWHHVDPSPESIALDREPQAEISVEPTLEEREEILTWRRGRNKAAGLLFLSLDESQRMHIRNVEDDPRKIWITLRDIHQPTNTIHALLALFSIRKEENETLVDLCRRVSDVADKVRALRPDGYTLDDLYRELQAVALIRALPSDDNISWCLEEDVLACTDVTDGKKAAVIVNLRS
ncbi:hypothetical protein EV360DRAFT_43399 [Lentinula raphanica]|nr:hypothetical protein EV360DRAFT_43399 [Lentinula raphanica]